MVLASASGIPSALYLAECDTTGGTYVQIPTSVFGGASGPAFPTATLSGTQVFAVVNVDLRARKRFIKAVITTTVSESITVLAVLGKNDVSPVSASSYNALAVWDM